MGINLVSPTEVKSGMLIADTVTSASGASDSIPGMTKLNGVTVSAALEVQSTLGAFLFPRMTTAQRDALLAIPGMQIYNSQTGALNLRDNTNTWIVPAGSGTVTSVNVATSGTGVVFTGGPITGSGTITATLDDSLQSIADLVSEGIMVRTDAGVATRSIATANAAHITISNANGVVGDPLLDLAPTGISAGSFTQADITVGTDGRIYAITSGGGSGGAPADASYILQTPSAFLVNGQPLSALSTGIMKSTTSTGVVSIAVPGTDYYSLNNPTRILDTGFAIGNFFIGSGAGNLTYTSAEFNTGLGVNSLNAISTGIQNTFAGHSSGLLLSSGRFNAGFGELCLASITNNDSCSALGFNAANALTTGTGVVAVGANSMSAAASATNVTVVGFNTSITSGISNAGAFGYNTSVTASNAINIGNQCNVGISTPNPEYTLDIGAWGSNSAIRFSDSDAQATPSQGIVVWASNTDLLAIDVNGVTKSLTTGGTVISITAGTGLSGGMITTSGTIAINNTAVSAAAYTVGNFTVNAQGQLTAASSATKIFDDNANGSLYIGFSSSSATTALHNTSVGVGALLSSQNSSSDNTAVGYRSLIGLTTGVSCVAIGSQAAQANDVGGGTVAVGARALMTLSGANDFNCAVGVDAGRLLPTGTQNTFIGYLTGGDLNALSSYNTLIGAGAGHQNAVTDLDSCTFVGINASTTTTSGLTNAGAFGASTNCNVSNAINLGNGCLIGINNPSPLYSIDIATIFGVAAILYPDSTLPATPSSGVAVYSKSGVLTYINSTAVGKAIPHRTQLAVSGTTKTFALADADTFQRCSNGSTQTLTIDTNANVPFPIDTEIDVYQEGVGQVVFVAAGGVTIQSAFSNLKIAARYSGATLKKLDTNTWSLVGNLTA